MLKNSLYIYGLVYDTLLEPLLKRWKMRLSSWVKANQPGLTLDICCGTGKQCRILSRHSQTVGVDIDLRLLKYAQAVSATVHFVCADAAALPFKADSFQNAVISLALHDKPEEKRIAMIEESKVCLSRSGALFLLDFMQPNSLRSKIGYAFIYVIEYFAGREHFINGRDFVVRGGLLSFTNRHRLTNRKRHHSLWGSTTLVMLKPDLQQF